MPIIIFTLMPSDFLYSSTFEIVKKPKPAIITPTIENMRPIGILISTILISSYQKNIVKIMNITLTRIAIPTGR
jgi:hypothetical protein